jgi:uncharacterized integral membrane protein
MRTRTLLLALILALVVAFTILNWTTINASTTLSLGVTTVEAPLGLTMLGLLIVITLVFAAYMAMWQASILMDSRRHAKELQTQRVLADQAEASRFTELRALLTAEVDKLSERMAASETALHKDIRESTNSLSAMLAEADDRTRSRGNDRLT